MQQVAAGDPADQELRQRLVDGDETALARVYDLYFPLVYRLAVRVTGDWAAAEDVVQEVFAHLWQRPEAFDPGRGPADLAGDADPPHGGGLDTA